MTPILSDSGARVLFEQVLAFLVEEMGAERALVLLSSGGDKLEVKAAHGINPATVWTGAPISLTLLEKVRETGKAVLSSDASKDPRYADVFSLQISGIRAVICVPVLDPKDRVIGLLYCDRQVEDNPFKKEDLVRVTRRACLLESALFGRPVSQPVPAETPKRGPTTRLSPKPTAPVAKQKPEPKEEGVRMPPKERTAFLRSLAVMMHSGIPIHRALDFLSVSAGHPGVRQVALGLARGIETGRSLSSTLRRFPAAFDDYTRELVKVGENSGRLHLVLLGLAEREQKRVETELEVRKALLYPLLLLILCTLMMILVPPLLLSGQLDLIQGAGIELPLATKILVSISDVARSPWFWLALAGMVGGLLFGLSRVERSTRRRWLYRNALRLPGLGNTVKFMMSAQFARSLSLQLEAGVPLHEALRLSGAASQGGVLQEPAERAIEGLQAGLNLSQSLRTAEFFPKSLPEMAAVGEETGKVPATLKWIADFFELELEAAVGRFVAAFEPMMMMFMGCLVGLILVATMLPMLRVVETL